ncbi:Zn-dependent hydrolase [Sporolactobacillus sp. KGMB 08714]|uniref:Zn-dependent hydrolase n=1 Tax=Sporolactobacillus sp. KGMB 08714 TaxID=3064704 RepID=UPI002FBDAB3C
MVKINRWKQTFDRMNQFGKTDNGMTRLAYSKEEQGVTDYFIACCRASGLAVTFDPAGNVIARRPGEDPDLPAVGLGSHLDTVYEGGQYDGVVGTLAALEIVRDLNDRKIRTRRPIDIFSFACEESSRFGFSMIGSKLMAGLIKKEDIAKLTDKQGETIQSIFTRRGLDFDKVEEAGRSPHSLAAFLELHIEQGPILEAQNREIGVVTGIAAPTRFSICVKGHAAHSGSTPMNQRHDALIGAAEIALELEKAARREMAYGTVATVGDIEIEPGAMNVVPGETNLKVDIRSISRPSKNRVVQHLYETIDRLEQTRHLRIERTMISDEEPVRLDGQVIASFEKACKKLKASYVKMPSGAGHDTMNMAALCPAGMIFIPSVGGISHHPDEHTDLSQIVKGIEILEETVLQWAESPSDADSGEGTTYEKSSL